MPDFTRDLHLRLEHLESEVTYLRQQQLLCRRLHHLRQRTSGAPTRTFLAHKVTGQVKWFNVKLGYGFVTRDDTKEDVFIYRRGILRNNPAKLKASVGDGKSVEFDIVFVEGRTPEAINVTGPSGAPVLGSVYAPDRDSPKRFELTGKQHESEEPIDNCCMPVTTDESDLSCDQEIADSNDDYSALDSDGDSASGSSTSIDPTLAPRHSFDKKDKDVTVPDAQEGNHETASYTPSSTTKPTPAPRCSRHLRKQESSSDSSDEDEIPIALLHAVSTGQPAASPLCQATLELEPSARTLCILDYWVYQEDGSVVHNA